MEVMSLNFIHAFDLSDDINCWNFVVSNGYIISVDMYAADGSLKFPSARDWPLELLRSNIPPPGTYSPRSLRVLLFGGTISASPFARVYYEGEMESPEEHERLKGLYKIEVEFEIIRREINPKAASRLSCIWIAEDSQQTRDYLKTILGNNRYIMDVEIIHNRRLTKADATWFDKYCYDNRSEFIENYWNGIPSEEPMWEYLLEGILQVGTKNQYNYIKDFGAHRKLTSPGTIDPVNCAAINEKTHPLPKK